MPDIPYSSLPVDQSDVRYAHGPDSVVRPDVPAGSTTQFSQLDSSAFPGTGRKFWIHVPADLPIDKPAAVMVFLDGWWYLDPAGEVRGGIVLDNLVHDRAIPPMIGVFVDPGVAQQAGSEPIKNRNAEYDAFNGRNASFLIDEIAPRVREHVRVADDPQQWGICGGSSGGNAAFTAAWWRPDHFSRIIAYLPSWAQIPGGNPYPALIADTPRKPLKFFVQTGHRDLGWNQPQFNWLAETFDVAAALARAGYDFRVVLGDGGHSPNHGGTLLPDALRWLWTEPDTATSIAN